MYAKTLVILLFAAACTGVAWAKLKVQVMVDGVGDDEKKNILAYLDIEQKKDEPEMDPRWLERLHDKAAVQIGEALQPFGYFSSELVEASLVQEGDVWVAHYKVEPGPKTKVGKVDVRVTGAGVDEATSKEDAAKIAEAVAAFPVKSGQLLDGDAYDKGRDALHDLIVSLGYPKARTVTRQVRVDPSRNQADIELVIDTGPKYYMGVLSFEQDMLNQAFLDRYVHVQPGDLYSQETLLELQSDLIETQYFSVVDVQPDFDKAKEYRVPVLVKLKPANRHKLDFGLGYFTDIGPTGSVNWQFRPSNRRGHYIDSLVKLSPVKSVLRFGYWIPVRDPRTDNLVFTAKYVHEDSTSQKRDTYDLVAGYYFLWKRWDTRLFGELKQETFTTGSQPETSTLMLSWGGSMERTQVDDKVRFPTRGNYWFLDLTGSAGVISDTAFLRGHVKTKHFVPLGERARLNLRGELGLAKVAKFEKYPSSSRFYAGGDQSVRGYKYQSLGPLDDEGKVEGGRNVVAASVELDYRFLDDWVAAVFGDAGNAFNDRLEKVYWSGGVGVRWLSPIGAVRVDFAVPGNPDEDADKWRVHFGFGADL